MRSTSTSTIGATSELLVAADLLRRGFEVFRAVSPTCSCDLGVLRDGRFLRVEVKTVRKSERGAGSVSADVSRFDILACAVWGGHGEEGVCYVAPDGSPVDGLPFDRSVFLAPKGAEGASRMRDCAHCKQPFPRRRARSAFCTKQCYDNAYSASRAT